MSSSDTSDDNDDKKDLTRLEDLAEFLHNPDPQTEELLAQNNPKAPAKKGSAPATLDELDDVTLDEALAAVESDSSEDLAVTTPEEVVAENSEEGHEEITLETAAEPPEVPSDEISLEENDTTEFSPPTDDTPLPDNSLAEDISVEEELAIDDNTSIVAELEPPPTDDVANAPIDEEFNPSDSSATVEPAHEVSPKENFQEVRDFGEAMTFGQVGQGGNPPYSVILRNIQYKEDAEEIKQVLKEHGLLTEATQKEIEQGLVNGSILLSQLAEYPAIFLAHAFRRFDLTLEMGLSAELHRSKSYKDENYRGLVSKHSLYQNMESNVDLVGGPVTLDQIILSTLSTLENYKIQRYLNVVSESVLVDELTFHTSPKKGPAKIPSSKKKTIDIFDLDFASPSLAEVYKDLAQKLRLQAKELKGNAVVGINYQITPITTTLSSARGGDEGITNAYRITCTGNVVWLAHLQTPQ